MRTVLIVVISFVFLSVSCTFQDHLKLTEKYFKACQIGAFSEMAELISDSLTIVDNDYRKTYSISEYYEYFQWDSVFMQKIEITGLHEKNMEVYFKVTSHSKRFAYLRHNPLITNQKISFKRGKISTIEILDYENFDLQRWSSHRDSLVKWIDAYQPELSGFIYDMTKNGAENYVKSIDLFNGNK